MLPEVAFDESGNTGQNLFDPADPIFSIGSLHLSRDDATNAAKAFEFCNAAELKFSKLRRHSTTRAAVLNFLAQDTISKETAKVYAVHKPFMVVTKFCDIFVEPSFRKHTGLDFYARDLQVVTANLIHHCMPTFLGKSWFSFLNDFVAFVRTPKQAASRERFRRTAELIYNSLIVSEPQLAAYVGAVLEIDPQMAELTEFISNDELDPLFTAYNHMADVWGRQLDQRFHVLADESKVLFAHAPLLRTFSDPNLKPFEAGYGERTTRFPLLVEDIMAIDSKTDIRVQLADLLAGAAAACLKASFREATRADQKFYEQLKTTMSAKQLFVGGLWPYHDLQTMFHDLPHNAPHPNQVSGPTYLTQILSDQPEVFRDPPPR